MDRGKPPEQDRQKNYLLNRKNDIKGENRRAMNAFPGSLAQSSTAESENEKAQPLMIPVLNQISPTSAAKKEDYGHLFAV